ncbi:MAG: type I 3-dehydroquinate dehydratase [Candidatus Hydrogenedens sp.]
MKKYSIPRLVACSSSGFSEKDKQLAEKQNVMAYELRLDLFYEKYMGKMEITVNKNISVLKDKNLIFTVRSAKEGGKFSGKMKEKENLYLKYLPYTFAVDIEIRELLNMKSLIQEAKSLNKIIIASYHNFSTVPSLKFLEDLVQKGKKLGADVVKIAVYTDDPLQIVPLMELQRREQSVTLSLMTMGNTALLSRTLFAVCGSIWTYASLGKPTAPNQPTCEQILECVRTYFNS